MTTAFPPVTPPSGPPPGFPPKPPSRMRRPRGVAAAIVLALTLSVSYGIAQILYWQQPEITSPLPWMRVWLLPETEPFKVTRVLLMVGWSVATLLALVLVLSRRAALPSALLTDPPPGPPTAVPAGGNERSRARTVRVCQFGILGALVLPYSWMALDALVEYPLTLLVCLPTTTAALLILHRVQFYRRMPVRLLLIGFGWGVLVGDGFGSVMVTWFQRYAAGYLLDWQHPRDMIRRLYTLLALNTGLFSELGKAVGVAVLLLLFRRHIDNVVSGIVIGAAVGLGANLPETVRYMALIDPGQESTQFWMRQVVGLPAAHVAFTAVVGAGFGAARQLSGRRDRLLVAASGLVAAVGGRFAAASMDTQLGKWKEELFSDNQTLILLLGVPLTMVLTSGLYVVVYMVILRRGLAIQAAELAPALRAEAETGSGTITAPEVELLLSPLRRFLLELRVWRRDGTAGLRLLTRLHQAQLALVCARPSTPELYQLRQRISELKGLPKITDAPNTPSAPSAAPAGPAVPPTQEVLS